MCGIDELMAADGLGGPSQPAGPASGTRFVSPGEYASYASVADTRLISRS